MNCARKKPKQLIKISLLDENGALNSLAVKLNAMNKFRNNENE